MKIIIFGATGDIGQKVVVEALSRQHHVTAVGRSDAKLAALPSGVGTVRTDLIEGLQPVADMMSGYDIAISTLRPDAGHETTMVELTRMVLIGAAEASVPIVITGGAALLKLADGSGHTVLSAPDFLPDAVRPIAEACSAQDALLESWPDVDWTCLRPPAMLVEDERKSQYSFGTDTLVTDDTGISQISYADFAAAMLDVAENRNTFARRITVAWTG